MSLVDLHGNAISSHASARVPIPADDTELAVTNPMDMMTAMAVGARYNPSELVTRQGIKTLEKMRDDDQIKAAMAFKKHAVLQPGWEIVSPDDQEPDWEVTEFVKWNLQNLGSLSDTFEEALLQSLSALDFGYSALEKIWTSKDTPFGPNMTVLKALKGKHPSGIGFDWDEYGNLINLIQYTGYEIKELPPEKFAIYSHNKEFGNWYGKSELEAAYRPWWVKTNAYRWMSIFLERLGIPPFFMMYDPKAFNKEQKNNLKLVLQNLQAATHALISRPSQGDTKGKDILDFFTPQLAGQIKNVFVPAMDMYNLDISRALLMPGLLGFTPDAVQGSFARANVHFDAFLMMNSYLQARIAQRVVQEQIINQMVLFNFGDVGKPPQFRFLSMTDDIRLDLMDTWKGMIEKGVVVAQPVDEDHIRADLGFPERDPNRVEPEKDEEVIEPEEDDLEPFDEPSEDDINVDEINGLPDKMKKMFTSLGEERDVEDEVPQTLPHDPSHESSIDDVDDPSGLVTFVKGEIKPNYRKIKKDFDQLEKESIDRLIPEFRNVRESLKGFITRNWDKNLGSKLGKNFKLRGIQNIRPLIRDLLHTSFRKGREDLGEEMVKTFIVEEYAAPGIQMTPKQAMRWLSQWEDFAVSGVIDADLTNKARTEIMLGLKNGSSIDEISAKLDGIFEPYIGNPAVLKDGLPLTAARLQTVVRTNITNAYNQGRLVEARLNPDLVQGMRYSAILDSRTTAICTFLNGKIYRLDDPELSYVAPPSHFNCRSVLVPVTITQKVDSKDWVTNAQKGKANDLISPAFGGKASTTPKG